MMLSLFTIGGLQGCAAIISGSNQKVFFTSNVDGAKVTQNLDSIGVTNTQLIIQREKIDNLYTVSKEGCIDTSFVLKEKFNYLCYLDILNPFALAIDYAFGSQFKTDNVIYIPLRCDSANIK